MGVKYVLSEPEKPGWWARNKPFVYLSVGFVIADGPDETTDPSGPSAPSPSPSISHPEE